MRDDICTIPVSEIFEEQDGCPICRMVEKVEKRIVDYIMGDAMMEPDVRIETNRVGFCTKHYDKMLGHRGRLQLALMMQTHLDEIDRTIFQKKLFSSPAKKGAKAASVTDTCFICDKIEFGVSRMIDTIYRTYETQQDFRLMFNAQPQFCLPHFERLISGLSDREMRHYGKAFTDNLIRITADYTKSLYENISEYCTLYDYRSNGTKDVSLPVKESVENTICFLTGRSRDEIR